MYLYQLCFQILPSYMCLAWSSIRYLVSLSFIGFNCPPIFVFKGKNVVGPFLPSISYNVLILFLLKNLLDKGYVSAASIFNDVCSSSDLNISCIWSVSFSIFDVRQSFAK